MYFYSLRGHYCWSTQWNVFLSNMDFPRRWNWIVPNHCEDLSRGIDVDGGGVKGFLHNAFQHKLNGKKMLMSLWFCDQVTVPFILCKSDSVLLRGKSIKDAMFMIDHSPTTVLLGIGNDVTFRWWPWGITNPEKSVWPSSIVGESYESRSN